MDGGGRVRTISMLALAAVLCSAAPQAGSGLVGYWDFEGVTGATVADRSGNGNTANVVGAVTFPGTFPALNFANAASASFDGTGGYLEIPNSPTMENLQEGDYTISLWVRPNAIPAAGQSFGLVAKDGWPEGVILTEGGAFEIYHWQADGTDADTSLDWTGGGMWYNSPPAPAAPLATGGTNWYHVAGVVRAASRRTEMFVSGTNTAIYDWPAETGAAPAEWNQATWKIGLAMPGQRMANALVDEVRLYNRALSAAEVAQLAAGDAIPAITTTPPPVTPPVTPPPPPTFVGGPMETCSCGSVTEVPPLAALGAGLLAGLGFLLWRRP